MNSIELFTGVGGLAIGISKAGFSHQAAIERDIERDKDACLTIGENQRGGVEADVSQFNFTTFQNPSGVDLLAGGSPCQPFSLGGKRKGYKDERETRDWAVFEGLLINFVRRLF